MIEYKIVRAVIAATPAAAPIGRGRWVDAMTLRNLKLATVAFASLFWATAGYAQQCQTCVTVTIKLKAASATKVSHGIVHGNTCVLGHARH
jgi:hypothetical protein